MIEEVEEVGERLAEKSTHPYSLATTKQKKKRNGNFWQAHAYSLTLYGPYLMTSIGSEIGIFPSEISN